VAEAGCEVHDLHGAARRIEQPGHEDGGVDEVLLLDAVEAG